MEDGRDARLIRLIECAVRAAAFRLAAVNYPESHETFLAAAQVNSARVAALADQIATGSAPTLPARLRR